MIDRTRANVDWNVADSDGSIAWEQVPIAVLMDIRRELRTLNRVFACSRFLEIPNQLEAMAKVAKRANRNAAKRRKSVK